MKPNASGNLKVAWGLLRHSRIWQWPGTLYYFLGVSVKKLAGANLFQKRVLHFQDLVCHVDVDGGCGLVFLYEIWVKETYDSLLPPGAGKTEKLLFDVGANCGFLALRHGLADPEVQVVCFEPHPRTFAILQRNIELNNLSLRVRPVQCAVGATSGKCRIELDAESSMAFMAKDTGSTSRPSLEVSVVSLDNFCREQGVWPDVLKIDVEGFEVEVLHGATECLRRARRLVVEYHNDGLRERCLEILQPQFETRVDGTLIFCEAR
jgi:FkbM family methyltransferase